MTVNIAYLPSSEDDDTEEDSFEIITSKNLSSIELFYLILKRIKYYITHILNSIRIAGKRTMRKKLAIMIISGLLLSGVSIIHFLQYSDYFRPHTLISDEYTPIKKQHGTGFDDDKYLSEQVISSKMDSPFHVGCAIPDVDAARADAAFVVLARNSEIKDVVKSMESLERHFNRWYNYPWVFLNDEPFDETFKETVGMHTNAEVEFGQIPKSEWDFDENLDPIEFNENINSQGDRTIMYGNLESYHKMCRFYSGYFYKHELVKKRKWYWRVEPDVEFYCDLTYDPFIEMEKSGKKYGFTVIIGELYYTVPSLFKETKSFIKKQALAVGNAWNLFILDSKYSTGAHDYAYDDIQDRREILKEMEANLMLEKFLETTEKNDQNVDNLSKELKRKLFKGAKDKPKLYEDRIDREEYNLCHFWSNFEIARTDIFNSPIYEKYFEHLEASGGFYKERWGDAPIHSLAVGMLLNLEEIHYFRDIGYRHSQISHCPKNSPTNQLKHDYTPVTKEDKFWSKPDVAAENGVGCRCRCPKGARDIEDSGSSCLAKWGTLTEDSFKAFEPLDLDHWEKVLDRMVTNYLATGGDIGGDSSIVDKLLF